MMWFRLLKEYSVLAIPALFIWLKFERSGRKIAEKELDKQKEKTVMLEKSIKSKILIYENRMELDKAESQIHQMNLKIIKRLQYEEDNHIIVRDLERLYMQNSDSKPDTGE